MITEKKILEIIEECKKKGYSIRVRDIAYVLLCNHFSDRSIAYRTVNATEPTDMDKYHNSPEISYLREYLKYNVEETSSSKKEKTKEQISFEENRAAMQDLLKQTQEAMDNGEIEPKDGLKILADIRVKLNDKFNVNEVVKDQIVVVEPKYNMICERYNVECYLPTKEQLMQMYNLKPADE